MNLKKEIDSILKNSKTYIQEMSEEDSKQQLLKERMEVDKEYKELQKKASRNVSKDPIIQRIKTILAKPNESNIYQQTRMISSRAESMKAGITKFLTGPYAHNPEIDSDNCDDPVDPKSKAQLDEFKSLETGSIMSVSEFK